MVFRPPKGFKPIDGFSRARLVDKPPFNPNIGRPRGARAEGIRYERKVQDYLMVRYPCYMPSPWIEFVVNNTVRYCQPDGLNFNFRQGVIQIVEVKLRHTDRAYWQTEKLYKPLLRSMFPKWKFHSVEVVKWYDPSMPFPCDLFLQRDIDDSREDKYGVHILWPIPKI